MIERIASMPAGTVGFRVWGKVVAADYRDVLVPGLLHEIEGGGGLRAVFVIEDLEGMDPAALWADAKLGFEAVIRHSSAWKRSAVVTDIGWMTRSAQLFMWMVPGEARVFARAELDAAKAWVSGSSEAVEAAPGT